MSDLSHVDEAGGVRMVDASEDVLAAARGRAAVERGTGTAGVAALPKGDALGPPSSPDSGGEAN